jgi:hypothetical protein
VHDWLLESFARPGLKAGDRTRTGDVQLGKLLDGFAELAVLR